MKYTQQQIVQMAKAFQAAKEYCDPRITSVLIQLENRGWPMVHSIANIQHLARMAS